MSLAKGTKSFSQMITRLPGTYPGLWTFYRIRHFSRHRRVLLCQRCYRYWGQMDVTLFGTRDWVWNICCSIAPALLSESNFSLMTGNLLSLFLVIYLIHQASKAALNQVVKVTQANPEMNISLVRLMLSASL